MSSQFGAPLEDMRIEGAPTLGDIERFPSQGTIE